MIDWIQRLCKWRTVFAGWQLGTRAKGDPECDAVRDHRELTLILRAEVSALTGLMIARGLTDIQDITDRIEKEAEMLCRAYERQFPGFSARDDGMEITPEIAKETTKGWKP